MPRLNYIVPPPIDAVDQGVADLCWLAATTVLYSWRDARRWTMSEAAKQLGVEFVAHHAAGSALAYAELALWRSRGSFGMEYQQCIAGDGWNTLLRSHGPLITLIDGTGSGSIDHAVVVYGIEGDGGSKNTFLSVANGQGGTLQKFSLHDFVTIFEVGPGSNQLFSVMYCKR